VKKTLLLVFKLAVTVGLLAYLFSRIELGSVATIVVGASWGWIVAGLILYLAIQGLSAWRWLWLARVLKLSGTWSAFVRYYYIGMFFNLFLPTGVGGDVWRCYYLARPAADWPRAIMSVLADRGVGFVTMCVIATTALFIFGGVDVPSWMGMALGGAVAGVIILVMTGLAARGPLASIRASAPLMFEIVSRPRVLLFVALLSVLLQTLVIVVNMFNGWALHVEIPLTFYFILIPLIAVATMIPISLNGLGVREGAFVFFLAQVGVPEAQALSMALAWLIVLIASSVVGGGVWLLTPGPRLPQASAAEARVVS